MELSWPNHLLSLADWEALPEDEVLRLEVVEGVLVACAPRGSWHQNAATHLAYHLDEQLPAGLGALFAAEVIVTGRPLTIRVPDVHVTYDRLIAENPRRISAAHVVLAIEILADGTHKVDRILKFAEYAEAGIAQYWMVDIDGPVTLTAYVLVDGHDELSGEHTGTAVLDVAGHPVTLDLDALVRR